MIVLPGPPRELQAMWAPALATEAVRAVTDRAEPYLTRTLRLFGIPESEIAKSLREIESEVDLSPLEITTCLRRGELEVDVRHRPGGRGGSASAWSRGSSSATRPSSSASTARRSTSRSPRLLRDRRRIGLGESCTAGLLAARLADPPGASEYLAGGIVAYSNEAKIELLGVPEELIERHGAVSPEVAEAMADGAIARFDANIGVGITGIAGPDGGTEEKPVGYVCVCVKVPDGPMLARDPVIPGDRGEISDRSCTLALHLIRRLLRGEDFAL